MPFFMLFSLQLAFTMAESTFAVAFLVTQLACYGTLSMTIGTQTITLAGWA